MEDFLTHFTYWGVVLVLLASGAGLPIPEDIPLITAGYLCAQGYANIYVMVPLTFVTVVGSDFILYLIGRKYGRHVPNLPLFRRFLTPQRLAKAEMAFHTHGGKTLFTSRFVPGVRAAVFFTAGVFKIPAWKLVLFDGAAAIISVPLLVLAGWYFSTHLDMVKEAAFATQLSVGTLVAIAVGVFFYFKWRKHKAAKARETASQATSPSQAFESTPASQAPKTQTPPLAGPMKASPSNSHP